MICRICGVKEENTMFELVPSEWMRKYLKEQGRELSDKEKAALIWNAPNRTLSERLDALEELARGSSDEVLKKQIKERTEYEAAVMKALKENPNGQFVYVVEDNERDCFRGIFADFDDAVEYAAKFSKEYGFRCSIYKQTIVSKGHHGKKCGANYTERAWIPLNESGEICDLGSSEISSEKLCAQKDRFEDFFFRIPFGMDYGIVRNVTDNTYGVLANNKEDWERYMDKWKNGGLDFSDIQVIVFKLEDNGIWSHKHINPLYLEPCAPENIDNDEKQAALIAALNALTEYFKNETEQYGKAVLDTAKAYAEVCHRLECKNLMKAKKADDIFR